MEDTEDLDTAPVMEDMEDTVVTVVTEATVVLMEATEDSGMALGMADTDLGTVATVAAMVATVLFTDLDMEAMVVDLDMVQLMEALDMVPLTIDQVFDASGLVVHLFDRCSTFYLCYE
jgi:hypothetical protein